MNSYWFNKSINQSLIQTHNVYELKARSKYVPAALFVIWCKKYAQYVFHLLSIYFLIGVCLLFRRNKP